MNENDLLPNLAHDDAFEVQLRGYSRRQVDEFLARCRSQIRDLEQRLARSLDDSEGLRRDLAVARQQALGSKPAHQEVSERIAQILKLADDEARSEKTKAQDEINALRSDAQADVERTRAEAREQAERMLTAAQEQAERAITTARAEADKLRTNARTEAEQTTTEAHKKAENALATAKAQAKKSLDEATARATAIHDGAERRLNLLSTRHGETIKRLTDILEGVSALVAAESARPSLEDEVAQSAARTISAAAEAEAAGQPSPLQHAQLLHAGQQHQHAGQPLPPAGQPLAPAAQPLAPAGQAMTSAGQSLAPGGQPLAPTRPVSPPGPMQQGPAQPIAMSHLSQPGVGQPGVGQPGPAQAHPVTGRPLPADPGGLGQQGGGPKPPGQLRASAHPRSSSSIDPDEQTEGVRIVPASGD